MSLETVSDVAKAGGAVTGLLRDFLAAGNAKRLSDAQAEGIKKIASAEVAAAEIKARGFLRVAKEFVREQANLEAIHGKVLDQFPNALIDEPRQAGVDDDWFSRWSKYARTVSDNEVQNLWAKILAEEIKQPKSFSLQTLHVLSLLRRQEAEDFEKLNNYLIRNEGGQTFVVPFPKHSFLDDRGLDSAFFGRLVDAGLIQANLVPWEIARKGRLFVGDEEYHIDNPSQFVEINVRMLTNAGVEIRRLCASETPDGDYFRFLANSMMYGAVFETTERTPRWG